MEYLIEKLKELKNALDTTNDPDPELTLTKGYDMVSRMIIDLENTTTETFEFTFSIGDKNYYTCASVTIRKVTDGITSEAGEQNVTQPLVSWEILDIDIEYIEGSDTEDVSEFEVTDEIYQHVKSLIEEDLENFEG